MGYILFKIFLIINIYLFAKFVSSSNNEKLVVKAKNPNGVGFIEKDLIEYIEEGKEKILEHKQQTNIQRRAFMVLGLTGTGKTTFVNYLNDVKLNCLKKNGQWILEVDKSDPNNKVLPGNFQIGQAGKSETHIPSFYTPDGESFSYIDNPGFADSHGLEREIANTFFIEKAIEDVDELKFLLLFTQQNLDEIQGLLFTQAIKRFSGLFKINENQLNKLSKSIGFIVTRVNNDGETDEEMIQIFKSKIIELLDNNMNAGSLGTLEGKLFHSVISNDQIDIFSNPRKKGLISNEQSDRIKRMMMNKLDYFDIRQTKMSLSIADNFVSRLFSYTEEEYKNFKEYMRNILIEKIENYVSKEIEEAILAEDLLKSNTILNDLNLLSSQEGVDFETFLNSIIDENLLDRLVKNRLVQKKQLLDYFVRLLPEQIKTRFDNGNKNFINELECGQTINQQMIRIRNLIRSNNIEVVVNDEKKSISIKSPFLKISQIEAKLKEYGDLIKNKKILIFAWNGIHFDKSIVINGVRDIVIISPNWKINDKDTIKINLSGLNGKSHENNLLESKNGLPGNLGENGGQFYGFGSNFIKLDKLIFELDGGNGGSGQPGGDGRDGIDGPMCLMPPVKLTTVGYGCKSPHTCGVWDDSFQRKYGIKELGREDVGDSGVHRIRINWRVIGDAPAARGTNGGYGGAGGYGGFGSQARIVKLTEKDLPGNYDILLEKTGKNGLQGLMGNHGKSGRRGCRNYCYQSDMRKKWGWGPFAGSDYYWEPNGRVECIPDVVLFEKIFDPLVNNKEGMLLPKNTKFDSKYIRLLLLDYKIEQYLINDQNNDLFLNELDKICLVENDEENKVEILFEECKALEKYFLKHSSKKLKFLKFYQNLYEKTIKCKFPLNLDSDSKKLLDFIQFFTLSRISLLNELNDHILVINIRDYLKIVRTNFDLLSQLDAGLMRTFFRKEYKEKINGKINEANEFLIQLRENIDSQSNKVKMSVEKLEKEITEAINSARNDLNRLEQKRNELKEAQKKKFLFSVLSVVSMGLGLMFPPAGPLISGVVIKTLNAVQDQTPNSFVELASSISNFKQQTSDVQINPKNEKLIENLKSFAKKMQPVLSEAKNVLELQKSNQNQIDQIDNAISLVNLKIDELNVFKAHVPQSLGLYMTDTINDLIELQQNSMQTKSIVGLDYMKKDVREFFKNILNAIESLITNQFANSASSFAEIIENLKESIEISQTIYGRVQSYQEHTQFADFISNNFQTQTTNYGKYQDDVNILLKKIQFSIVEEYYKQIIDSVKQWIFPFAVEIISDCMPLSENMNDNIPIMRENLIKLERHISLNYATIQRIDSSILTMSYTIERPFYTWSCSQSEIKKLFDGKKIILKADVQNSKQSAVKFKKIDLKITSETNNNLERLLEENYQVKLLHSGTSYFKYKSQVFKSSNDKSFMLVFSFKKNHNGLPFIKNNVYDKMLNGDFMISPYTSWIVQLESINDGSLFRPLPQFDKDQCDIKLSLIGEGNYVDPKYLQDSNNQNRIANFDELNLDKHYNLVKNTI